MKPAIMVADNSMVAIAIPAVRKKFFLSIL